MIAKIVRIRDTTLLRCREILLKEFTEDFVNSMTTDQVINMTIDLLEADGEWRAYPLKYSLDKNMVAKGNF